MGPDLDPERTDMTETVLSSATREVVIGFDRPFVMIGERINPTGRKLLAEEMRSGDFSRVEADAVAQVEAGAHMLDVNAGIPLADEPALLTKAVELVQATTDVPLSIDSSIVEALESAIAVYAQHVPHAVEHERAHDDQPRGHGDAEHGADRAPRLALELAQDHARGR